MARFSMKSHRSAGADLLLNFQLHGQRVSLIECHSPTFAGRKGVERP
jgi:hypothetical protein